MHIFSKILLETKKLHYDSIDDCKCFISALYSKPLPKRGEALEVSFGTRDVRYVNLLDFSNKLC